MIMTRDQYEDALLHPLQHPPFEVCAPSRPLRPLKRTRAARIASPITPPRSPPKPRTPPPLSLTLPPPSPIIPAPLASPRSPFLPTAALGNTTCPHCGLNYPNPEIDAYTPDELEQLDFLHALGNWAWDAKCAQKLIRLRAPFERLHRQRPTYAEAIGAAARTGMNAFASQLVARMDAQQCRINENLNSLKLHIICNLHGHDGPRASEAWERWIRGRTPWASDTLRVMTSNALGDPAAMALELFRDVLRDLGEEEVGAPLSPSPPSPPSSR
ncbi:hypothetical protein CC85DRAFT_282552 [Cutaneotrichosporon oleaginosum]|uniref:Uncharacterized protein n=1 Tax=Cutaneotrichosporon oleaginosum TaxID=879819 RepID=A0A0J0XWM5_9TREE|nr:uncharacterized protein CC85DRAFT_282552 [Cutaneotrichosporon oleaginosum]KLT45470.1 hypothetical protein CC85DRAFT_282552 [Cutaneotrichosporon oleaginosum]TXT14574.1 hypothetical protein COLE_00767 [Cutaneotrichosporon oleaginosum]